MQSWSVGRSVAAHGPVGCRSRWPDRVHCLVEIPKGSRNKYEWDEELQAIKLDRFLFSSVVYPTDYGFIPDTCGEDGDPLDAMVCVSEPTFPGCVIPVKVIALFRMRDDKGDRRQGPLRPAEDPNWNHMETLDDLPQSAARRDQRTSSRSTSSPRASTSGRRLVLPRGRAARRSPRRASATRERTASEPSVSAPDVVRVDESAFAGLPGSTARPAYAEVDGLRIAYSTRTPAATARPSGSCTASRPGRTCGARSSRRCATPASAASPRPRRLRPLRQADRPRLVLLRPPHRGHGRAARASSTCATRRWSSTTGAGRSGCASSSSTRTAFVAPRDPGHRAVHRPPEDERRLDGVPRLRRAHRGPADRRSSCAGRLRARAWTTRPSPAYEAPFPTPASKAGARAFPLMLPTDARRCRAPQAGPAGARRAGATTRARSSCCGPTATRSSRSRPASGSPSAIGAGRADRHRERLALPPGGRGRGDRRGTSPAG